MEIIIYRTKKGVLNFASCKFETPFLNENYLVS